MKIKMDKVTVTEVEMELPDTCPGCGIDVIGSDLVEEQLIGASQDITVNSAEPLEWDYEETETCADICHVVGYRCGACGHQLATTEVPATVQHTTDGDCAVAGGVDETGSCTICGVVGGYACTKCGGERFHRPTCSEVEKC
jgi:hypothetical protein